MNFDVHSLFSDALVYKERIIMNCMKYPIYNGDLTYLFVGQDIVPRTMEGG